MRLSEDYIYWLPICFNYFKDSDESSQTDSDDGNVKTSVEQRAAKLINILKVSFIMHKIMVVLCWGLPYLWFTEGEGGMSLATWSMTDVFSMDRECNSHFCLTTSASPPARVEKQSPLFLFSASCKQSKLDGSEANVGRPMLNVPNTSFIFRHFERIALPLILTLEGSICVAI